MYNYITYLYIVYNEYVLSVYVIYNFKIFTCILIRSCIECTGYFPHFLVKTELIPRLQFSTQILKYSRIPLVRLLILRKS